MGRYLGAAGYDLGVVHHRPMLKNYDREANIAVATVAFVLTISSVLAMGEHRYQQARRACLESRTCQVEELKR